MKKISLSLVAVSMLTTFASADIISKKISGDAKLFFSAVNSDGLGYSDHENNLGDVAVNVKGALNVGKNAEGTINWGITGVSTLGLDGHAVGGTWITHQKSSTDANITDAIWIDTLNLTVNPFENTTLILGRQELDTPMVFSEHWNIATNTYDAVVVSNSSLKDTTLVGAWVGRSNIAGGSTVHYYKNEDSFKDFGSDDGAYAFGLINKTYTDTTLQAWYYDVTHSAKVAWLQADSKYNDIDYGLQYASYNPSSGSTSDAVAVKVGYDFNGLGLTAAYSTVSDDNNATSFVNVGGAQSKLYTDAWWMVGSVAQPNTDAFSLSASYDFGFANASLFYTDIKQDKSDKVDAVIADETKIKETTLVFDKSIGSLDASFAFVNVQTKVNDVDQASDNEIQAYLTYHF